MEIKMRLDKIAKLNLEELNKIKTTEKLKGGEINGKIYSKN
jgi:hypothetical protein